MWAAHRPGGQLMPVLPVRRPPRRPTARVLGASLLAAAALAPAATAQAPDGRIGPALSRTNLGRHLTPVGRMTAVGDLPTGGALTPDGRFYWAVDSGHGHDEVAVVDVASGAVLQVLALPGAFGGVAFSADGRHAYVSGEPRGNQTPVGPTTASAGDAIHV